MKERDTRPLWQQPQATADAKVILSNFEESKLGVVTYGEMTTETGLSQQRVELAILHIIRVTGMLKWCAPNTYRLDRPRSLVAKPLLGKQESGSSILPVGSDYCEKKIVGYCKKIHYWPDGPPEPISRGFQSLWCGATVGSWEPYRRDDPVDYYWTRDIVKVTCGRCLILHHRKKTKKPSTGIMEVV